MSEIDMRRFCVVGLWLAACAADPIAPAASEEPPRLPAATAPDPLFDDPLAFDALPPPRPESWRALFDEPGQSYIDYVSTAPRRPQDRQLYLLPLAEMGTAFVVDAEVTDIVRTPSPEAMTTLLAAYYGVPASVLPSVELTTLIEPERVRRGHEQFRAQTLLRATEPRVPDDAYSMTSLMVQDVFFDEAQAYGFGFGLHLCPECLRKLLHVRPMDPLERYAALSQVYADLGLELPLHWAQGRLTRLEREAARSALP